ncbi:MAG: hypothetical protein ABR985_14430 [Methanotrichaceae archaeon]
MTDWTDPIVIVGMAQIFMALVLALFTSFLWKSTDKYAKLTEKDLKVKEKIRQIERRHKELDNIIGPLYSKLRGFSKPPDQNYFNPRMVWGAIAYDDPETKIDPKACEFWSDIKKNLYLTTPETRKMIEEYYR